jgi:peroxiredoxin Q/BCP
MRLEAGDQAPAFAATDQNGDERTNTDFGGSKLVMYFYPKAFTPGCTTEACDFRDRYELFSESGVEIIAISPDQPDKLAKFKNEHDLPFDLLSDPDNEISTAYGAYGLKKNYGREYMGIIRSTFLVDATGVIEEAYYNVRAKGHAERVTKAITAE